MAQRSDKPKRMPASGIVKTSSPGKVYQSRASKPSGVAAMTNPVADLTYSANEVTLLNDLKAKVNELIAALKK